MYAPQYPKGLVVFAYVNHVDGDVWEFDTLNHYIGMRPLDEAAAFEKMVALPGVIIMALMLLAAIFVRSGWTILLALPAILFPPVFLIDLFYWLNKFGQGLDPKAPLSNSIPPFTPTILGEGIIGQFRTVGVADIGLLIASAAAILALLGLFLQRRAYKPLVEQAGD